MNKQPFIEEKKWKNTLNNWIYFFIQEKKN